MIDGRNCRKNCVIYSFVFVSILWMLLVSIHFPWRLSQDILDNGAKEECEQTSLAYRQSYGFFRDINDDDWKHLQQIATSNPDHTWPDQPFHNVENAPAWYQENWEPNFSCRFERRIGCMGDGGKWVCDPHRIGVDGDVHCLVYSVGSRGEVDFELALLELLGGGTCEFHIFDPAENFREVVETKFGRNTVHYHSWGLKGSYDPPTFDNSLGLFDGTNGLNNSTYFTLSETIEKLGHRDRVVDIFKIDCEGCEWLVYQDWLEVDIRQILVETHKVPVPTANSFFTALAETGYVMFHKEPNIQFGSDCVEFGFLKLDPGFLGRGGVGTATE